jgi:hypothetical protein
VGGNGSASKKEIAMGNPKHRLETTIEMLPTPVVKPTEDVVIVPVAIKDGMNVPAMLPTPDSHMERGVAKEWKPIRPSGAHASFPLNEAVAGTKTGLKLQPGFVEYLMGYPKDWTKI